ncbi:MULTISPECIES: hypothetical protein [Streptomyces]|nr:MULTISPECIES: hypothetical protein [Streptomyces]
MKLLFFLVAVLAVGALLAVIEPEELLDLLAWAAITVLAGAAGLAWVGA